MNNIKKEEYVRLLIKTKRQKDEMKNEKVRALFLHCKYWHRITGMCYLRELGDLLSHSYWADLVMAQYISQHSNKENGIFNWFKKLEARYGVKISTVHLDSVVFLVKDQMLQRFEYLLEVSTIGKELKLQITKIGIRQNKCICRPCIEKKTVVTTKQARC